ncbi:Equilibrative nucleoside transporter 3 [Nymphon striatum]|nr:Equilibrative nucleoside transporter 3 [Nymphon striatum]
MATDRIPLATIDEMSLAGSPAPQPKKAKNNQKSKQPKFDNVVPSSSGHGPESQQIVVMPDMKPSPSDRYKWVYMIIMLHGVGTLMPWNMFITAEGYFTNYKLGNETVGPEGAQYRNDFLAYMGISAQLPNVLCNALNLFMQFGGSLTVRIVWSLFIEIVLFIFTIVLAMVDSSSCKFSLYLHSCQLVRKNTILPIFMVASGVYQNTVFGLASKLPMKYTNAVILGSVSIFQLLSLVITISSRSPNLRTAAIYYFLTALFVLLACLDTYFALPLIVSRLLCEIVWPQCFNVFMVFFVTLSIFPNIHAAIKPVDKDFAISPKYFSPVTCFLTFNFFAMVGNIIPNWFTRPGPKYVWIPILLRILFIPFYMFCNYDPDLRGDVIPFYINNDWIYFSVSILLGLTSGYFSSLAMMYAPRCVQPKHAQTAGMMAAFFLVLGIFCGVNFSLFLGKLLQGTLW